MKTTITENDGKFIATLEGSLDTAAAEKTAHDLEPLHDCKGHDIIIDCSQLTYISSSGLRILLTIRKYAAANGSNVTIKGASDDIRYMMEVTGFHNLFNLE